MKKLLLTLGFLLGGLSSAFATCASPAVMHDFPGSAFNMSYATNAGDGNCSPNVAIIGTLPAFASTPAFTISSTLPAYAAIPTFKIDQTTPGTTNAVQDAATSATGSAVPAKAIFAGARSGANLVGLIQADTSVKIDMSTATITQLVALSGSTKIYVTSWDVIAGGATNFKLVYGTGSNCGTGTTDLTGAYPLTAQSGISKGSGLGPVLVVPAGNALCANNGTGVQVSGAASYTQF